MGSALKYGVFNFFGYVSAILIIFVFRVLELLVTALEASNEIPLRKAFI